MGSFLVIGMGRFGSAVATELFKLGHEVVALDDGEEAIAAVADHVTQAVIGDAKDEAVLRSVGVKNFDSVIVAIANELSDSILTTLLLRDMGANKIICKAQGERHAKALKLIGADVVIRPEHDMGKRLAHTLAQKNIIDYIQLSPDHSIAEIEVPRPWLNKSLTGNNLRSKYGITVLAVRKKDTSDLKVTPSPDYVLTEADLLVVIGENKAMAAIGIEI